MNLEEASYPLHLPIARDLHRRLVDAFYEPNEVLSLVKGAKAPNWAKIDWKQSIDRVWRDTLSRASAEGGLRKLLTYIAAESAMPTATKEFVDALLADTAPASDPALTGPQGEPLVPAPTREEALLFGDDLTESVGEIPALLHSIELVMRARSSICKLLVDANNGLTYGATATLLVGGRLLTNHHALYPNGGTATRVIAEFDFELDASGQAVPSKRVPCEISTIHADAADDWATIALATTPPATAQPFDLAASWAVPKPSERAFIIQHPAGKPKRLGLVRNKVSTVEARRLFYVTDTEGGSSGSLVFNGSGKVIGLHRAGGVPQKFVGMAPVKMNEGVRMDVIVSDITKAGGVG